MTTPGNPVTFPSRSKRCRMVTAMSLFAACFVFSNTALAQVAENNLLEGTLNTYRDRMTLITGNISALLVRTFYLLALLEFTWGMIKNYLDNGGLQGFVKELITRILFIGFFLYLFQNGTQFPLAIVNSFRDLAVAGAGTTAQLTPDNIVDIGQNFIAQAWDEIIAGSILSGLGLLFASLIVFVAMIILAAHLAVAILEFYVVGYGGFVLLAFGASRWTHGYAVSYLKYAMSVGMKLFVLLIIVAVIEAEMRAYFFAVEQASITNVWAVAAFALFSVILGIVAPQSVMGMMSGVSVASGGAAASAMQTLGSTGGVAATGVGSAVRGAGVVATSGMGAATAIRTAGGLGSTAAARSSGGALRSAATGASVVAKETVGAAKSGVASALSRAFPVRESSGGKLAARFNSAKENLE